MSEETALSAPPYSAANSAFRRSVISMWPGLWVMQKGGLAYSMATCGVMPQAQKTGEGTVSSSLSSMSQTARPGA